MALFSTILDTTGRSFYGLNNSQAVFSFVDIEKTSVSTLEIEVYYGLTPNITSQVLQFRTFNPIAKDYFPEGVNYQLHKGEGDCSLNCNNWDQFVYTSTQIGGKAFNNYWFNNTLQAGGTWINIHTSPISSDIVPGWWQAPRYTAIPCAGYGELNGYVDVTSDYLSAQESILNKKCFNILVIDVIFVWPTPDNRYVWAGLTRWGNYVRNPDREPLPNPDDK